MDTSSHLTVGVVRNFYQALGAGDVPSILVLLHDNLEWTEAERFPYYSGTWHTPAEVVKKLLIPLSRDWDGFSANAEDFIAEGDRVVSMGYYTGTYKSTGRSMTAPFAHVWKVRDGRVAQFNMYVDTVKVMEALRCETI